jgi:formate hydrogenlyase subunit 3/multisubunit Na+/H+ antiporter MnhD subunit
VTRFAGLEPEALLLAAAVVWPVSLASLWLIPAVRRVAAPLVATMALPALVLAFMGDVALELRLPGVFTSMALGLDAVGRPFLLLTAVLWSIVAVHALRYTRDDRRRRGFLGALLATGAGNIGLTIAVDALSFYLFFAVMTFAAYGLILHTRTEAALRAARIYIIMAVFGEALLLGGLFAIAAAAPDATFAQLPAAYAAVPRPGIVATLLLLGFGVKAGLLPLHLWLPLAHPVAPTPASALLSGAMIKAGVLGWLRFLPLGEMPLPELGTATMTAGVAATLFAAGVGVTQTDAKTVLAYSSISQMGFLATGVGAALVVPDAAPLLMLAVAVYAIHHAFAKAALFLSVGLVPGVGRGAWLWTAGLAIPALALAGAPLTSGAMAKDALKRALGDVPWPVPVDLLLSAAAVGTTLLMARFLVTLRTAPHTAPQHQAGNADHVAGRPATPSAPTVLPSPGRPPAGLVLPWLTLVVLCGVAALWLPYALAPLGEMPLATAPVYLAAALWPIALGAILYVATAVLYRRHPALTIRRVPAGDIVALLERGAAAGRRFAAPVAARSPAGAWQRLAERAAAGGRQAIDAVAAVVEGAPAGPALGAALCLLALLLFLTL